MGLTPRPKPATYSAPPGSSRICVAAVCGIPLFITRHVRPPSSLRVTPPVKLSGTMRTLSSPRHCAA